MKSELAAALAAKKLAKKKMACGGQVNMAEGGEVSPEAKKAADNIKDVQVPKLMIVLHPEGVADNIMKKKINMADGGMVDQEKAKKFEKGFGYGSKEERPTDFNEKASNWIASTLGMKKKAGYAEGGEVESYADGGKVIGQEDLVWHDPDGFDSEDMFEMSSSGADFLSQDQSPMPMSEEEDPAEKKRRMMRELMDELHQGHFGKK